MKDDDMGRPMTKTRFHARSALAALVALLAGCLTGTPRGAAEATFATRHPGCQPTGVRERPDPARGDETVYEVTGCNADETYQVTMPTCAPSK
jgi:hypothetical protein